MRTQLVWLSAALSLIGLFMLFLVQPDVSPQTLELKGVVKSVDEKGKVTFISVVPEEFSVISFDAIELEPGEHTLRGHLQEYKGKVEFVVEGHD